MPEKKLIGKITHFYPKISVAVIELQSDLRRGDKIEISGKIEPFQQIVESMQIEHQDIESAQAGQSIGLKVDKPVKQGCEVYKIIE